MHGLKNRLCEELCRQSGYSARQFDNSFAPMPHQQPSSLRSSTISKRNPVLSTLLIACVLGVSGCTVLAVADLAASAVVGTAGLVVDAAVGTAKIGGKVIGKTADVVMGGDAAAAPNQ